MAGSALVARLGAVPINPPVTSRFVGVDMAADPRFTGLAVLAGDSSCVVEELCVGVVDADIVRQVETADRVGVDVPLGWPESFLEVVTAHAAGTLVAPDDTGPQWRRPLAMRATDREVHRRTGLTPLSVSTDRIAHPALRWAGIEARLRKRGTAVDRAGFGVVCEVYPAAALRLWGLPYRGYKGRKNVERRAELVVALRERHPRLEWNGHRDLCLADDNALDAVLAALIARDVAQGVCIPPPDDLVELARREGWVWLPGPA